MPNNDEKIVKALEALQADVTAIKIDQGKQFDDIEKRQVQQGKILMAVSAHTATILQEQQQQRTAIRSLHDDLHRVEQKIDKVVKDVKSNQARIENLEEATNTHNPQKN